MARHSGPVLVDTNAIIECHRTRSWRALAGGYAVETVDECVEETATGFQRRKPEQRIETSKLRASLHAVHPVGNRERAKLMVRISSVSLDCGEMALWAHALQRKDAWLLCGPDKASLLCGILTGHREQLVSLEQLLCNAGFRPNPMLREAYTSAWHKRTVNELIFTEANKS